MLLTIDIGNTEITAGLFGGDELTASWRMTTQVMRTADEWTAAFQAHLAHCGVAVGEVRSVVHGSVVPTVTGALAAGVHHAVGVHSVGVGADSDLPIVLDVAEPMTVGADRVLNTLAASTLFGQDTIVVDFGTATTYDCITGDGRFLGGVIAPGVVTGSELLVRRTAKLPATELEAPDHAIGRRTEDCIRAGVLFGAADAADGMIRRIRTEWPTSSAPRAVATGGLAAVVRSLSREIEAVEPNLTLLGLRIAARHLGCQW